MTHEELMKRYAAGIAAAKPKMVARFGEREAAIWEINSIRAAQMYAWRYAETVPEQKARQSPISSPG